MSDFARQPIHSDSYFGKVNYVVIKQGVMY